MNRRLTSTSQRPASTEVTGNRLLGALPARELQGLAAQLERVTCRPRDVLCEYGRPVDHVYFPISCVALLMHTAEDGSRTAACVVGNDGLAGVGALLGGRALPGRVEVQISGACYRAPESVLRLQISRSAALRRLVRRYVRALLAELAQTFACRCAHAADQRLVSRLLLIHDRADRNELPLTQDVMAALLGVRRETVSQVAGRLRAAGAIHYARGRLRIVGRRLLEDRACECYRVVRAEYDYVVAAPSGAGVAMA